MSIPWNNGLKFKLGKKKKRTWYTSLERYDSSKYNNHIKILSRTKKIWLIKMFLWIQPYLNWLAQSNLLRYINTDWNKKSKTERGKKEEWYKNEIAWFVHFIEGLCLASKLSDYASTLHCSTSSGLDNNGFKTVPRIKI